MALLWLSLYMDEWMQTIVNSWNQKVLLVNPTNKLFYPRETWYHDDSLWTALCMNPQKKFYTII